MKPTTGALCAAVLATLAPSLASAADNPHGPLYYSVQSAAEGALNDALSRDDQSREWAGIVYRCGDVYSYTEPQPGEAERFRITARFPKGCALAGLYHTHPGRAFGHTIPAHDKHVAATLRVPSYIGVVRDGSILLHVPRSADDPRVSPKS